MYELNMNNAISINFLKFAWFLTKQDLRIDGKVEKDSVVKKRFMLKDIF